MTATTSPARTGSRSDRAVVAYLAFLSALMALSIDTALPAFDEIRDHFELGPADNRVSLVITTFFAGTAIGQLFYGPFADRFGRGPVLRFGLGIYAVGALGAALAPSLPVLLGSRFVWGLGAAAPGVLRLAIARDLYTGDRMARVMSTVMAVFLLAPVIAPTIGEGLVRAGGWRWTMAGPGLAVTVALVWSVRFGETLRAEDRRPLALRPTIDGFRAVLRSPVTLRYALGLTFNFGAFFVFLGSSQPILDEIYGRGDQFPLWFAVAAATMAVAVLFGARLVAALGARGVVIASMTAFVVFSAAQLLLALVAGGRPNVWIWFALVTVANCGATLTTPSASSLAMEPMGHIAGTASAVTGMMGMAGGAILAAIVDSRIGETVTPMAVGYVVYGSIALGLFVWAGSPTRVDP